MNPAIRSFASSKQNSQNPATQGSSSKTTGWLSSWFSKENPNQKYMEEIADLKSGDKELNNTSLKNLLDKLQSDPHVVLDNPLKEEVNKLISLIQTPRARIKFNQLFKDIIQNQQPSSQSLQVGTPIIKNTCPQGSLPPQACSPPTGAVWSQADAIYIEQSDGSTTYEEGGAVVLPSIKANSPFSASELTKFVDCAFTNQTALMDTLMQNSEGTFGDFAPAPIDVGKFKVSLSSPVGSLGLQAGLAGFLSTIAQACNTLITASGTSTGGQGTLSATAEATATGTAQFLSSMATAVTEGWTGSSSSESYTFIGTSSFNETALAVANCPPFDWMFKPNEGCDFRDVSWEWKTAEIVIMTAISICVGLTIYKCCPPPYCKKPRSPEQNPLLQGRSSLLEAPPLSPVVQLASRGPSDNNSSPLVLWYDPSTWPYFAPKPAGQDDQHPYEQL